MWSSCAVDIADGVSYIAVVHHSLLRDHARDCRHPLIAGSFDRRKTREKRAPSRAPLAEFSVMKDIFREYLETGAARAALPRAGRTHSTHLA